MLEAVSGDEPGVRVTSFEGLTVDFARRIGASCVIRGVRAMSDFEYEFEMALMNKHLYPEIETLFMMASQQYLYVSSSRLKELVRFGRDVERVRAGAGRETAARETRKESEPARLRVALAFAQAPVNFAPNKGFSRCRRWSSRASCSR